MKKNMVYTAAAGLLFMFFPAYTGPGIFLPDSTVIIPDAKAKILLVRLQTIKETDQSILKPYQQTGLRNEMQAIRHQLHASHRAAYLSAAAVLLLLLLLLRLLK